MGGISSDADLENGPVEEPEGKNLRREGRTDGRTDDEKGERPGRNTLS